MSSAAPPPAAIPAPTYPGTAGRVGHRLGGGAIAAIIAVVILIAALVTPAMVLTGTPRHPEPAHPVDLGGILATTNRGAPSRPGAAQSAAIPPGGPASAPAVRAPSTPASSTPAVNLRDGISVTPAAGWTIESQVTGGVWLLSGNSAVELWVAVGKAQSGDIGQELSTDIAANSTDLTNVQLYGNRQPSPLQSANFQQAVALDYTADLSTQLGTTPINGVFFELLNTSTGVSAFLDLRSTSEAELNAATDDVGAMLASML